MPSSAADVFDLPSFPTRRSSDLDVGEDGGLEEGSAERVALAAGQDFRAFGERVADVLLDLLHRGLVDERALHDAGLHAVADFHRFRSEEHTSELQSHHDLVCRLLPPTSSIYPLSLHDALPILTLARTVGSKKVPPSAWRLPPVRIFAPLASASLMCSSTFSTAALSMSGPCTTPGSMPLPTFIALDRKSTRLNSSHITISYAVFCRRRLRSTLFPYTTLFRS